jgi:hypothetical protein
MDPIPVIAVLFGAVICFFGYPMISAAIRVWGFLTAGALATVIAVSLFHIPGGLNQLTIQMGIAFVVGGVIGAIVAGPFSLGIIFMTGLAGGWLIGVYVYPLLSRNPESTLITVILALVTGVLAARFQEVVMIVITAFTGALMMAYGTMNTMSISNILLAGLFFLLLFFGAAAQYKSVHPESSLMKM